MVSDPTVDAEANLLAEAAERAHGGWVSTLTGHELQIERGKTGGGVAHREGIQCGILFGRKKRGGGG